MVWEKLKNIWHGLICEGVVMTKRIITIIDIALKELGFAKDGGILL